ncbi:MAG: hypothetical protein HY235_27275, partial [Acidobacteria bacterium]|nr:hypothetical protein [Acidobacteriota bacterium]
MDALYFRVSSERQTTENQFDDLLQVAERDGAGRDWARMRELPSQCVYEEQLPGGRTVYRVRPVLPVKSQTGPISSTLGKLLWAMQAWYAEMENDERAEAVKAGQQR